MTFPDGEFWYAVHTKPQQELRTRDMLNSRGIDSFVPLQRVTKRYHNGELPNGNKKYRTKSYDIAHPSFKRFVICLTNLGEVIRNSLTAYYVINTTPGVTGLVGIDNKALVMNDDAITTFLCMMDSNFYVLDRVIEQKREEKKEKFIKGDVVEITAKSWHGYQGIFEKYSNSTTAEVFLAQMTALTGKPLKIETNFIRLAN